jgi:hypothetical protein
LHVFTIKSIMIFYFLVGLFTPSKTLSDPIEHYPQIDYFSKTSRGLTPGEVMVASSGVLSGTQKKKSNGLVERTVCMLDAACLRNVDISLMDSFYYLYWTKHNKLDFMFSICFIFLFLPFFFFLRPTPIRRQVGLFFSRPPDSIFLRLSFSVNQEIK